MLSNAMWWGPQGDEKSRRAAASARKLPPAGKVRRRLAPGLTVGVADAAERRYIRRRIRAARQERLGRERRRHVADAEEEHVERVDGVGDVDLAVIVRIGGILAGDGPGAEEEHVEGVDRVGDVVLAVVVG